MSSYKIDTELSLGYYYPDVLRQAITEIPVFVVCFLSFREDFTYSCVLYVLHHKNCYAKHCSQTKTVVHQTLSIIVSLEHSDLIILFFVLRHPSQM